MLVDVVHYREGFHRVDGTLMFVSLFRQIEFKNGFH
jgi:hypothetical protein